MNKYCMGVVVYNPTMSELKNIEEYANSEIFDFIMIYDNSPKKISYSFKNPICQYKFQNENSGLAKPYNEMISLANQRGYDYLCIMDQDSSFKNEEIKKMKEAIDIYETFSNVAIFCPTVLKKGFEEYERRPEWLNIEWCINSGSFLNLKCLKNYLIKYDDNIFLDGLDYDFCWTVAKKGCRVMQYCNSLLVQSFGYQTTEKQSFTYHSAFRYYLISHNRKYIFKKHFGVIKGLLYAQLKNIFLSIRILFYEENKMEKFKACIKGIVK